MLGYYLKVENEYYIWIHSQKPKAFLFGKIKTAILYSFLMALPIVIILGISNPQNIWILLLLMLIGWAVLAGQIVSKYAAYPTEMSIMQAVYLMSFLNLPPILIFLIPYLFKKSEIRLRHLLK
jgi:hypothetical protein